MPEHQNIEYKQSWRDEYLKWICGFANAQGGKIFIGIDDKGTVTGIDDHKKLMEDIPNKIVNHLGIVVDVNLHSKSKQHYIEIQVQPSDLPIAYHGIYHYRSGSTKQELKGASLQQFILKKMGRTWDDIVSEEASIRKDIDPNVIQAFLNKAIEVNRISPDAQKGDIQQLLQNLRLINDKQQLKNAALLLFSKDPLKYFTTAYFKIGRFGKSHSDLITQDIVEGSILTMADRVIELLRTKYLTSPIHYKGLQRIEQLEYPEEALREAILNAIVHKNYLGSTIQLSIYDDRLILWNPGRLPDDINTGEIMEHKHPSHPFNKNIAEIFFRAGFIEAWGRGLFKITQDCRLAGLPDPIIENYAGGVQATFLKDIYTLEQLSKKGLNERQIEAVLYMKANGSINNSKYQELNNTSRITATRDLQDLIEKEMIVNAGTKGAGANYTLIAS